MTTNRYVTGLKNVIFDNYSYFTRNLHYVINVTHRNLRYGASRLFINPHILPVYEKNLPKFARLSSSL